MVQFDENHTSAQFDENYTLAQFGAICRYHCERGVDLKRSEKSTLSEPFTPPDGTHIDGPNASVEMSYSVANGEWYVSESLPPDGTNRRPYVLHL